MPLLKQDFVISVVVALILLILLIPFVLGG